MWCRGLGALLLLAALHTAQPIAGRRLQQDLPATTAAATTLPASALLPADDATPGSTVATTAVELRIINGDEVTTGDFDFMVALFMNGRFFCGGALLDNTTVLTAAHCIVDTGIVMSPESLTVWSLGTEYPVAQVFAHPGYSASTIPDDNVDLTFEGSLHDIAVVKLASPGVTGNPPTAQLPAEDADVTPGQRLQVSGWGTTESGEPSNVLKYATVAYLPPYNCPSDYSDVLCGGGTGENTCNGDSGGPLLLRDSTTRGATAVGVTSHGPDCLAGPNYAYGYYTDVRKYLDAIASWRQGLEFEWSAEGDSSGEQDSSTDTSSSDTGTYTGTEEEGSVLDGGVDGSSEGSEDLPADFIPDPIVWQPVPGWEDQWSTGSPATGTWQEVFCQIFGC